MMLFRHNVGRCVLALLAFRIMHAAGLLKLRARDSCWREHTCFIWHYENMPMPNPLTWFAHRVPLHIHAWVQYLSIDIIEIILPYGFLAIFLEWFPPLRRMCCYMRRVSAISSIALMLGIHATGNYSFLNLLTCLPCLVCLDDALLQYFAPSWLCASSIFGTASPKVCRRHLATQAASLLQGSFVCAAAVLLVALSVPGLCWLWDPHGGQRLVPSVVSQLHRTVGQPMDLGNMYSSGRFAHVTRERFEAVLWAADCHNSELASGVGASLGGGSRECRWLELDVPCKPGSLDRAPCFTSPFHRRLAWQFWFVGLGHDSRWLKSFCEKLVRGDVYALDALETGHPFSSTRPPHAVHVRLYRYRFSLTGSKPAPISNIKDTDGSGSWWQRTFERELLRIP